MLNKALLTSTNDQSDNNDIDIQLIDYIEVVAKKWRFIFKFVAVAAVLSAVVSICMPNKYGATTRILPPQQDASLMSLIGGGTTMGSLAADLLGNGSQSDTYQSILKSETVSDAIIDRFHLMSIYDEKYRSDTYKVLDKNVNITIGKKDGIITITVLDKDPARAAAVANAYVEELDKLLVKINTGGALQDSTFYYNQLLNAKKELTNAEDKIKQFQTAYKALDITEQTKGAIKGVADFEVQLAAEEANLGRLRQTFTDNSQEVKNQKAVVDNIRLQIKKFEGERTSGAIPGISSVPQIGQQYIRLMRDFKIQEAVVELLTKQYEISKLTSNKRFTSLQIIQTARIPDKKLTPKRTIIVIISSFVSLIISMLYVFMNNYYNLLSDIDKERWKTIFRIK